MSNVKSEIARPLPKDRTALRALHDDCVASLQSADRSRHRNERTIELYRRFGNSQIIFAELNEQVDELRANHERDQNNYAPSAEHLLPYCDPGLVVTLTSLCEVGAFAFTRSLQHNPIKDQADADKFARSHVSYTCSRKLKVYLLRDLRDRIAEALQPGSSRTAADTSADIARILAKIDPRNPDITGLQRFLERNRDSGESQRQLAIQFTDGNEKQADTLLRGLRRYRSNLTRALCPLSE